MSRISPHIHYLKAFFVDATKVTDFNAPRYIEKYGFYNCLGGYYIYPDGTRVSQPRTFTPRRLRNRNSAVTRDVFEVFHQERFSVGQPETTYQVWRRMDKPNTLFVYDLFDSRRSILGFSPNALAVIDMVKKTITYKRPRQKTEKID